MPALGFDKELQMQEVTSAVLFGNHEAKISMISRRGKSVVASKLLWKGCLSYGVQDTASRRSEPFQSKVIK